MHKLLRTGAALAAALIVSACADPPSGPPLGGLSVSVGQSGTSYIVVLQPNANQRAVAASVGAAPRHVYSHALNGFAASLPDAAVAALQRNPNVVRVEPDGVVLPFVVPVSWGQDRIDDRSGLDNDYTPPNTGAGVTVYVLDSGIEISHPEFQGRATHGADFVDGTFTDCTGHGTHVAGTVGGATVGVARDVSIVSVRVLGCTSGTESGVIAGIDWVTGNAVRPAVANMSLGGGFNSTVNAAVAASIASGVSYAVAAGNSATFACVFSPASAPNALTVAGSASDDTEYAATNYGSCVDLYAPAVSIPSAFLNGGYAYGTGTSMASPHVAGAAALVLSANPTASPAVVSATILGAATKRAISGQRDSRYTPNLLLYVGLSDCKGKGCPKANGR